jgi:hypothetical protein
MKLLIVQLHYPVISSLLGPNILFRNLFSNTLSLCSSLNVRATSHPYKRTDRIMGWYIYIPGEQVGGQTLSEPNGSKHTRIQFALVHVILIC